MLDIFGSVKHFFTINSVQIDNNVFRLHYKVTVVFLIVFSLLVTSRQYIGDPIDCIVDVIPGPSYMDTYCWIHSTFTYSDKLLTGSDVIHPGVSSRGDETKYHKHYQWVCFVLFLQAIFFYVPHYLWKSTEAGKMKMLVLDLNQPIIPTETKNERKKLLVDYLTANLNKHNSYALRFFLCEVLNFINVVAQIYFANHFLDGDFATFGKDVIDAIYHTESAQQMRDKEVLNPRNPKLYSPGWKLIDNVHFSKVFPKVTKCTFDSFGVSGTVQKRDGLCVLPINVVNEKIYIFLWFWFIILAVISGLGLLYRLAIVLGPQIRMYLLRSQARLAPLREVEVVARRCQIGDWFILYHLGKNIDPLVYKEIVCELAYRFEGKDNEPF